MSLKKIKIIELSASEFVTKSNINYCLHRLCQTHLDYGHILYDQAFSNSFHYYLVAIMKKFSQQI